MSAPKLRFKEFDGDWKSDKVGKFLIEYKQKVPSSTDIEIYSSSRNGLKPQKEYFDNRELQNFGEYGVVPPNYLTYRHMSDDTTFKFNINLIGKNIAVSKEYPVFTTNDFMDSSFLLFKLNESNDFKKFAIEQKKGGTRTRLYFKALCSWETLLPIKEEQTKIASFLSAVDEKISQLTQKHQLLSQYKQGMMQKLFSQQIRFKADDGSEFGEWEETRLAKVSLLITKGTTPKIFTDGNINFLKIEALSNGKFVVDKCQKIDQITHEKELKRSMLQEKDILFAIAGATIGKNGIVDKDILPANTNQALAIIRLLADVNHVFVSKVLNSYLMEKYIEENISVGAQPNLNLQQMGNFSFSLPCLEEQTKIANFLSAFDQKIDVVSQQIAQAKQWKKGLLQQMFV